MADIDDRGQLLLVTGFAIAVAMVALVLLLNTSIYMENRATRSLDTGADDALAFRATVEDDLWGVVEAENEREYDDRTDLRANASAGVERFVNYSSYWHLESGANANVTNRTLHNGTRLVQEDGSRDMISEPGGRNWTMATGVDDVRAFEMNFTDGLENTTSPEDDAFNLTVRGAGGDEWSFYVYDDNPLTSDSNIAVRNDTGLHTGVCSGLLPSDPPRVNLTAGTVEGSDCDELVFAEGTNPPYEIEITYGDRAEGTYNATVNGTPPGVGNFNEPTTSPYEVPIVYSVSFDVVYQTSDLEYRARIQLPEDD